MMVFEIKMFARIPADVMIVKAMPPYSLRITAKRFRRSSPITRSATFA